MDWNKRDLKLRMEKGELPTGDNHACKKKRKSGSRKKKGGYKITLLQVRISVERGRAEGKKDRQLNITCVKSAKGRREKGGLENQGVTEGGVIQRKET